MEIEEERMLKLLEKRDKIIKEEMKIVASVCFNKGYKYGCEDTNRDRDEKEASENARKLKEHGNKYHKK